MNILNILNITQISGRCCLGGPFVSWGLHKDFGRLNPFISRNRIHRDLILAMILFEGCFPVGHLNPGFGHFKHYAEYTKLLGPLMKLWMMAFERYPRPHPHTHTHPRLTLTLTPTLTPTLTLTHTHTPQVQ